MTNVQINTAKQGPQQDPAPQQAYKLSGPAMLAQQEHKKSRRKQRSSEPDNKYGNQRMTLPVQTMQVTTCDSTQVTSGPTNK